MQNRLGGAETTVHNQGSINNHLLTLAEFHSFSSVCFNFPKLSRVKNVKALCDIEQGEWCFTLGL